MKTPKRSSPPLPGRRIPPVYCTHGEVLCRVRIWTEAQWAELDEARRPAGAEHVPGVGWAAPVPAGGRGRPRCD